MHFKWKLLIYCGCDKTKLLVTSKINYGMCHLRKYTVFPNPPYLSVFSILRLNLYTVKFSFLGIVFYV